MASTPTPGPTPGPSTASPVKPVDEIREPLLPTMGDVENAIQSAEDSAYYKDASGLLSGFESFLMKGNVVDTAVGIVIGVAFTNLVNAFVKDFITPAISSLWSEDFSAWQFTFRNSVFAYGDFINNLISFVLVCFVVYFFIVLPFAKLQAYFFPPVVAAPPAHRKCPSCKEQVAADATRCKFCTSYLHPPAPPKKTN